MYTTYVYNINIIDLLCQSFLYLDTFLNISLQPSGFSQNIVGQQQDIICSIVTSLPAIVDPNNIELGWLYEEEIITADNRVTINSSDDYSNQSTLVTNIHFDPLSEDDEDEYFCYAIINGSFVVEFIYLHNFTSMLLKYYVFYNDVSTGTICMYHFDTSD